MFFFTLEGLDCSGKSQVVRLLKKKINSTPSVGSFTFTREPGGSFFAEKLRCLFFEFFSEKNNVVPHPQLELLVMLTQRSSHVESVILPSLKQGKFVFCDRYVDSTFAYQIFSRKALPFSDFFLLEKIFNFPTPDLTFFIKTDISVLQKRLSERRKHKVDSSVNYFDFYFQDKNFLREVEKGYQLRIKENKQRFIVVDGSLSIEEITLKIYTCIFEFIRKNQIKH